MSAYPKAKYQDGREYEPDQHKTFTGYGQPMQRCYRCNQNKGQLGGKRHPILGLLCKQCVEVGK